MNFERKRKLSMVHVVDESSSTTKLTEQTVEQPFTTSSGYVSGEQLEWTRLLTEVLRYLGEGENPTSFTSKRRISQALKENKTLILVSQTSCGKVFGLVQFVHSNSIFSLADFYF
ncbi:hypothetical protein L1987_63879 [Smallanthus sonchifolius]|uniref:Uncharacterized protein n=1 Tax=Smallanthus sonchifolius TaxID=185202 RepID=A0ACB9CEV5_9ASTR|nr:hypothetical protein L1987_63879 [Smallanthus sonchifolius]